MSAYTKGPWQQGMDSGHIANTVFARSGESIAQCFGIPTNCEISEVEAIGRWKEGMSNARLIAAAPELLEALKDCQWGDEGRCPQCGSWHHDHTHAPNCIVGNSIAKAEGL